MNILLTGASGFIGGAIFEKFKHKHRIYSILRKPTNLTDSITFDLRDTDRVDSLISDVLIDLDIDLILHGASRLIESGMEEDISVLYDNLKMTDSITRIAKVLNPRQFINLSSIAVYPNQDGIFNEESVVNPSRNIEGIYGISKFLAEELISFKLRNTTTNISHLRLSQVYGDGMRKDRVISIMKAELELKNQISVFGNGERTSNFISIEYLLSLIDVFLDKFFPGVYNVGEAQMSYKSLAEMIISKYGGDDSKIILEEKGSRSKFRLDTTKLNRLLKNRSLT